MAFCQTEISVVSDFAYVASLDTCKITRATCCSPCPTGIKRLGLGYVGHPRGCLRWGLGREAGGRGLELGQEIVHSGVVGTYSLN